MNFNEKFDISRVLKLKKIWLQSAWKMYQSYACNQHIKIWETLSWDKNSETNDGFE